LTSLLLVVLAAVGGGLTGLAGRVVYLLGLYDLVLALALGVAGVALWHLQRQLPPRWLRITVGLLVAVVALSSSRLADVWAFYGSQLVEMQASPEAIANDLLVAGVDSPQALLDAGLQVETGHSGLRGALLLQIKTGLVMHRVGRLERVLPLAIQWQGLVLAGQIALVLLLLTRTWGQLVVEPRCPACGRYLRRTPLQSLAESDVELLAQAWRAGQRLGDPTLAPLPASPTGPVVATLLLDQCPLNHLQQPGLAIVRLRRRSLFGTGVPGQTLALAGELTRPQQAPIAQVNTQA
jgi:hypothetical protein